MPVIVAAICRSVVFPTLESRNTLSALPVVTVPKSTVLVPSTRMLPTGCSSCTSGDTPTPDKVMLYGDASSFDVNVRVAVFVPMDSGVNWTVRSKVLVGGSVVGGLVTLNMLACVPVIAAVMSDKVSRPMLLSVIVVLTGVSISAEPTLRVPPERMFWPACVTRSSGCGSARQTQMFEVTPPLDTRA